MWSYSKLSISPQSLREGTKTVLRGKAAPSWNRMIQKYLTPLFLTVRLWTPPRLLNILFVTSHNHLLNHVTLISAPDTQKTNPRNVCTIYIASYQHKTCWFLTIFLILFDLFCYKQRHTCCDKFYSYTQTEYTLKTYCLKSTKDILRLYLLLQNNCYCKWHFVT